MFDLRLCFYWLISRLPYHKWFRFIKRGLWVNFKNGQWVSCTWNDKKHGYINHPLDGGTFHIRFNLIIKIEDYT